MKTRIKLETTDLGSADLHAFLVPGFLWADGKQARTWCKTFFTCRVVLHVETLEVEGSEDEELACTLRIYPNGYDSTCIREVGMLYTDPTFEAAVQAFLFRSEHPYRVSWSEKDLQGEDYAHMNAVLMVATKK